MEQKQFEELQGTWNQMKAKLEQAESEKAKYGEELAETKSTIDALNARIDEIETKGNRPGLGADTKAGDGTPEVKAFNQFLRKGADRVAPDQVKLLSADSDSDGGFLMPTNQANSILMKLIEHSPIRELATVITISSGDTYEQPAEDTTDFSASWTSERGARAVTTSGKLRNDIIQAHEMYANPLATQKLLDDAAFNVETWLNARVAKRFAVTEGTAFVSGTGAGQPEGILTNASVTSKNSGDANLITADGLIDLFHDLPEFYARSSTWLFKRATLGAIRKLKDSQNRYLWEPGLQPGDPGMLLGRPYRECVDMPAVAASAYPVVFGDIAAAYTVVDRQGIRVVRDPYSSKPSVEFYTTKRVGGAVVLAEAIRKLRISA